MVAALAIAVLATTGSARAGLIDDFASRDDWACSFGTDETTCGGPDAWHEIEAAHTVRICGAGEAARVCGHTWKVSGDRARLLTALQAWAPKVEARLESTAWLQAPARQADDWVAVLRDHDTVAELEVGRGYVQVRLGRRPACAGRDAALALDNRVRDLLPEVEDGDPVALLVAAPWAQLGDLRVGPLDAARANAILDRPPKEAHDKMALARWKLLASEPYVCVMEQNKLTDPVASVPEVLAAWRAATQPTPEERRAQKALEREQARLARKHQDVAPEDDTLSDEPAAGPADDELLDEGDDAFGSGGE